MATQVYNYTELDEAFETHDKYLSCYNVAVLPLHARCSFVRKTAHCQTFTYWVDYVDLLQCKLLNKSVFVGVLGLLFMLCMLAYLLLAITLIANGYFGPSLKVISKRLRMNEHLAGVTLLALGNSVQDFFTNLDQNDLTILFTNSACSAIFVILISCGSICLLCPFQIPRYSMITDVLFLLLGVSYVEFITLCYGAGLLESISIIMLYGIYLMVILIDNWLEKKNGEDDTLEFYQYRTKSLNEQTTIHRSTFVTTLPREHAHEHRATVNSEMTRTIVYDAANNKNENLLQEFIEEMKPIKADEWRSAHKFKRVFLILCAPLDFVFKLLIPVVDVEREKHGWSKFLNCIHIVTVPLLPFLTFMHFEYTIFLSLLITVPAALLVYKYTRTDVPPQYHFAFTLCCCIGSMMVIFICAREISQIATVIAMSLNVSERFIAITFECWGSSVGMLVTNITLALHGYERMAFAASYGGPFFSILISNGTIMLIYILQGIPLVAEAEHYTQLAYLFILIVLGSNIVWAITFDFYARRSVGVFNFILYILFVVYAYLAEQEVIHSFALDVVFDPV